MLKVCVNCGSTAELLCARCQDPYCSRQCQRLDWTLHRSICISIPPLIRDMSSMDLSVTQNMSEVASDKKENESHQKDDLSREKNAAPESEKKKKTTKAVDPKEQQLESAPDPVLQPVATVEQRKPNDLEKPVAIKKQIPLKLPNSIAGRGMTLPDKSKPKVIREETAKPLTISDLKVRTWPVSKNIRAKILGVVEYNVMTLREDKEEVEIYYEYITKEIAAACATLDKTDYKPIIGEIVFTKFEDVWYRVVVLETSGEKTVVKYIDYGHFDELAPGTMYPAKAAKFEVCSRDFFIDNISETLTEKQSEIILSGDLTITNVRKEADGTHHCSIFGF